MLTPSEFTTAVGFFLTLTSLLGAYFYVHLSNWFREILELKSKYEINSDGEDEKSVRARMECRFQLRRLYNHVPLLVSSIITAFILLMIGIAARMVTAVSPRPPVLDYYVPAFWVFLGTYLLLTLYFLVHGYAATHWLHCKLNPRSETQ
ncbi:MAG: hypothetical protein AB1554_08700 [Chloroflexota bacterium]